MQTKPEVKLLKPVQKNWWPSHFLPHDIQPVPLYGGAGFLIALAGCWQIAWPQSRIFQAMVFIRSLQTFFPFLFFVCLASPSGYCQDRYWTFLDRETGIEGKVTWSIDLGKAQDWIQANKSFRFPIPDPEGQVKWLWLSLDTTLLAKGLTEKYSDLRFFNGQIERDQGSSVKFDIGPNGIHAWIYSPEGEWFVEPVAPGTYSSFYKNKTSIRRSMRSCLVHQGEENKRSRQEPIWMPIGDSIFTYRIAIAATGEYSAFFNNDTASVLASIGSTIHRINGIFERDLAVRFQLIENTDTLFFFNPDTDPFEGDVLLGNTLLFNRYVGVEAYDIGHVFSVGNAGVALLGSVCDSIRKAGGFSSFEMPFGNAFDLDYVAHEIGHQFGADHTFNNCGLSGPQPFEPGSGSTIMSYAGICGPNNLASGVDGYFHSASVAQIVNFTRMEAGRGCASVAPSGNTIPQAQLLDQAYTLPVSTPFELQGKAFDPDGDQILYNWEQWDIGPRVPLDQPEGNAPLFRSFEPDTSPIRIFPRVSFLLEEDDRPGEVIPEYARSLTFRMTIRDQRGGLDSDLLFLDVTDRAGPFKLNEPSEAVTWQGGQSYLVAWEVSKTDLPPVNVDSVWILFSPDGGTTFPDTLAKVSNSGSAFVMAPSMPDTVWKGLLKIKAADHLFFALSPSFITILPEQITAVYSPSLSKVGFPYPNPTRERLFWPVELPGGREQMRVTLSDLLGRRWNLEVHTDPNGNPARQTLVFKLPENISSGSYFLSLQGPGLQHPVTRRILVLK